MIIRPIDMVHRTLGIILDGLGGEVNGVEHFASKVGHVGIDGDEFRCGEKTNPISSNGHIPGAQRPSLSNSGTHL